ncbi:hypothetical protein Phab24_id054 [Acinetobacter phage Phab24]|nr:hypothetical protein Phab24_id054 [Acinetobacter phage Phab24]
MDKKALLEQFEALPLMVAILNDRFIYVDQTNEYAHQNLEDNRVTLGYVNGAWYAFQHQQAKVCSLEEQVEELQKQLSEYIFVAETIDEMYVKEVQKSDELQKRVDAAKQLIEDLNKCYQQDHQNKFEYWRGFADSAGIFGKRLEQALHGECTHESDGSFLLSNPPRTKCKKCGEFYFKVLKEEG